MRILVTGLCNNYGGIESFFFSYYREIMKRYDDIQFDVLGYHGVVFENEITQHGGKVFLVESFSNKEIKPFMKLHAKEYDLIWCNVVDLNSISIVKYANRYCNANIILHSHCSSMMGTGFNKIKKIILHYIHRLFIEKYVTDFWACSDLAAQWMFPSHAKIKYIPNAIDARSFRFNNQTREIMRKDLKCGGSLAIGFIGRLSQEKNPFFALDIYNCLKSRTDAKLYIVGDGPMKEDLNKRILKENLSNVKILGRRNDVNEIMQALDCIIMPSLFEGMPIVAIESQAAGLHVFLSLDHISMKTKIVKEVDFLDLSSGAEGWTNKIISTELYRRDTLNEIISAGFEIESASCTLYKLLKKLQSKNSSIGA